jgi:hypothetical protein
MRRTLMGWFFATTGFLACPCHLVITLPLTAALLSGTALGGWIAGHQGAIFVGASIYFIGALAGAATLLLIGKGALISTAGQARHALGARASRVVAADCCRPTGGPSQLAGDIPTENANSAPARGVASAEVTGP